MYIISKKKNKNKKDDVDLDYITAKISESKQYLKYKNKVSTQSLIIMSATALASLTLALVIFLPIFQIKLELFGETIATKNFSFFDNYQDVKNNYNQSSNQFTDITSNNLLATLLIIAGMAILSLIYAYFFNFRPSDLDERTKKMFIYAKTNNYKYLNSETICGMVLISIVIFICTIINSKNAEFNFDGGDMPYTVTQIDNYLYYNFDNSALSFKVFLNNFKFCNGVSGYIAVPIISLICSIALYGFWQYSKWQLKKDINAEKIDVSENAETNTNAQ